MRYAPNTDRIVGLTVLGARRILTRDGHLAATVPEKVEATAEDLAPRSPRSHVPLIGVEPTGRQTTANILNRPVIHLLLVVRLMGC